MKTVCLNFTPDQEQMMLIRQAKLGNREASSNLAYDHNILFLPELGAWCCVDGNQHIEDYRCGRISAEECKTHFISPTDAIVRRVMSAPTPKRQHEDW